MRRVDVAVVGGGPAGLAAAIVAASRGVETLVLERSDGPVDKACGEGLMPAGVRALEELDAVLPAGERMPFVGIRYLQAEGGHAAARFAAGPGLGVRRTALVRALERRAREVGAALEWGVSVTDLRCSSGDVALRTDEGEVRARIVVAADGLGSGIRRRLDLEGPPAPRRRFGVRRHYAIAPWSDHVEVHWAEGVEAYITPVAPRLVGVAFLWDEARLGPQRFDRLLRRFPALAERLAGAAVASADRGAGPLARSAMARTKGRVLLLGDAGGYVDALSGEGLSLAFRQALALGPDLPDAVVRGAPALGRWQRETDRSFRRYALLTGALLLLSDAPRLRRGVVRALAARSGLFEAALAQFADGGAPTTRASAQRRA